MHRKTDKYVGRDGERVLNTVIKATYSQMGFLSRKSGSIILRFYREGRGLSVKYTYARGVYEVSDTLTI